MDFLYKNQSTKQHKNAVISFHHLAHGLRANINYKDVIKMNISKILLLTAILPSINIYNTNIYSIENIPTATNSINATQAKLRASRVQPHAQPSHKTEMEHNIHSDLSLDVSMAHRSSTKHVYKDQPKQNNYLDSVSIKLLLKFNQEKRCKADDL